MLVGLSCKYCGFRWEGQAYDRTSIERMTCPRCNDHNLIAKDLSTTKVDYYAGSPPFEDPIAPDGLEEAHLDWSSAWDSAFGKKGDQDGE